MVDLNKDLKLPDLILAEQTLTNAGITENMQLLIRSALQGNMTLEKVSVELIAQHSKIHERESRNSGNRFKGDGKSWKHHGHRYQRHGYVAEEYDNWNDAEAYASYDTAVEDAYEYVETADPEYEAYMSNAGADECQILAMMAADGLDMDNEESMDYVAEVI